MHPLFREKLKTTCTSHLRLQSLNLSDFMHVVSELELRGDISSGQHIQNKAM